MKKINDAIRCANSVAVIINRVSIRFNREEGDRDFSLGDRKYNYREVSALANAASGIVIDTESLQISLRKEGNSTYYEKVKIRKDGSEFRSVYDAEKEQGDFSMTRKGITVEKEGLSKHSFLDWVEEFGLNYFGIK